MAIAYVKGRRIDSIPAVNPDVLVNYARMSISIIHQIGMDCATNLNSSLNSLFTWLVNMYTIQITSLNYKFRKLGLVLVLDVNTDVNKSQLV